MKRENRYVVIKIKDADKYLSDIDRSVLNVICDRIQEGRSLVGKPPIKCVVVEDDWPEYEDVWGMFERRVDDKNQSTPIQNEIYYSHDEEIYRYQDLSDVADKVFDEPGIKPGDVRSVWSGEASWESASYFLPGSITEQMGEYAWDNVGEHVDTWPDVTKEQDEELQKLMCKVVESWADKHHLQPTFFTVTNIKEIKVKLLNDNGDFEIVN